ncbi:MAG: 50S ribosomal protein L21 [Candidatus Omnitrophica bacterium ADurb.Bin205]|nr:MAG: 50S ribosomal protein L21 [Candidatus Omnitrophica bacterium ADurb.Bin205]
MYAVIEIGAKQYNVKKGDVLDVDKQDVKEGKDLSIEKVLLLSKDKKVEVGQPYLKGVKVTAEVVDQVKGDKVISFKYRRRKSSHWTKGHRAKLTRIRIKEIESGS